MTDLRRTLSHTAQDLIESPALAGDDDTSRTLDLAVDEAAATCRSLVDSLEDWLLSDGCADSAGHDQPLPTAPRRG